MAEPPAYPQDPDADTLEGWAAFAVLPRSVARDGDLGHAAKAVLLALASYAGPDRTCFPGIPSLVAATGMGRRSVDRALAEAEAAGYLRRRRTGRATRYRLVAQPADTPPVAQQPQPGASDAPPAAQQMRHGWPPKQYQLSSTSEQETGANAPVGAPEPEPLQLVVADAPGPDPVRLVFDAWRATQARPGACQLTPARRKVIRARLAEGYSVDDLCAAAQGWQADPWPERPRHNGLEVLLRNGGAVERFAAFHRDGPATRLSPMAALQAAARARRTAIPHTTTDRSTT